MVFSQTTLIQKCRISWGQSENLVASLSLEHRDIKTHIYGIPYSNKRRQQGTSDKIKMVVQWDTQGICLQIQMDRLFLFVFPFNSLLFRK